MKKQPAFSKACSLLRALIERCRSTETPQLPTVRSLSKQWHLSPVPILKALHYFQRKGLIQIIQGRGIFLSEFTADPQMSQPFPAQLEKLPNATGFIANASGTPTAQTPKKWQIVSSTIIRDISAGIYGRETILPNLKELCNRYGTAYPTIRQSIAYLLQNGYIEYWKKGYRPSHPPRASSKAKLLIISRDFFVHDSYEMLPYNQQLLAIIERECQYRSLTPERVRYRNVKSTLTISKESTEPDTIHFKKESFLGILINGNGLKTILTPAFIQKLLHSGLPVVILDSDGTFSFPRELTNRRNLFIVPVGITESIGENAARFCIQKGHQNCIWLSSSQSHWARNRLAGVEKVFSNVFGKESVHSFSLPVEETYSESLERARKVNKKLTTLFAYRDLHESPQALDKELELALQRSKPMIRRHLQLERRRKIAAAHLSQIASGHRSQLWICANDTTALLLKEFLINTGHRIPETVSLFSFDDSIEASIDRLTSSNLNLPATIRAAIDHIIDPGKATAGEYDYSYIVDRGSVGDLTHGKGKERTWEA